MICPWRVRCSGSRWYQGGWKQLIVIASSNWINLKAFASAPDWLVQLTKFDRWPEYSFSVLLKLSSLDLRCTFCTTGAVKYPLPYELQVTSYRFRITILPSHLSWPLITRQTWGEQGIWYLNLVLYQKCLDHKKLRRRTHSAKGVWQARLFGNFSIDDPVEVILKPERPTKEPHWCHQCTAKYSMNKLIH